MKRLILALIFAIACTAIVEANSCKRGACASCPRKMAKPMVHENMKPMRKMAKPMVHENMKPMRKMAKPMVHENMKPMRKMAAKKVVMDDKPMVEEVDMMEVDMMPADDMMMHSK